MNRNEMGLIILDDLNRLEKEEAGRKKKVWLEKDNKEYLFKAGASNYEIFAEVISSELAKQCGIETAEYDIAIYNGIIGVVTPSFLKTGDNILSGEELYDLSKSINPNLIPENSIENILKILSFCTSRQEEIEKLKEKLTYIWLFDGLIYESDRNFSNWSIIINGRDVKMAPLYDCSTMCRMNNNIHSLINSLSMGHDVNTLMSSMKFQLKRKSIDNEDNFIDSFHEFCIEEPEIAGDFIKSLDNINVEKACESIEQRMSDNGEKTFEFPWECSFWINKIINQRIITLKNIYELTKTHNKKY